MFPVAIIGRSELLYNTAQLLLKSGFNIPLIITAKEAPEYKIKAKDYRELADQLGSKFIQTPMINQPDIIDKIKQMGEIPLAVSINYSGIIAQEVIDLFPLGILNAHGGDLPRYRGNACQAWAIINGESRIGLCIHKMIGGELDSGDIIARSYFDVIDQTRVGEVYDWMEKEIPLLMFDSVKNLSNDSTYYLEKQSKNPSDALRCYPRRPEDGKINWYDSNLAIVRLINASSEPFSGSFCQFEDNKLLIWRASLLQDEEQYLAIPGQVSKINTDGSVEVICGKGKIKILEVEYNNERDRPSKFINSIRKRLI